MPFEESQSLRDAYVLEDQREPKRYLHIIPAPSWRVNSTVEDSTGRTFSIKSKAGVKSFKERVFRNGLHAAMYVFILQVLNVLLFTFVNSL